jgi:hypothetical protein
LRRLALEASSGDGASLSETTAGTDDMPACPELDAPGAT